MKKQFGRSMIEMLAVLAIVGVLSIGGVWGYRKAITKHLANSVVDDINLSGFLIMSELFNRLPDDDVGMDMTGKFDQKSPYTFKAFAETATSFEILVQGVPYSVCQEIIDRELKDFDEVRANGFAKECTAEHDNEVSFFFDSSDGDHCLQDSDCGECGNCNDHKCLYGFKNYKTGKCFSCNQGSGYVYEEDCHRCKNKIWRLSSTEEGQCLNAINNDRDYYAGVRRDECLKHPKHYFAGWYFCFYCSGTFDRTTGVCSTARCVGTPNGRLYGLDKDSCEQCGGTYATSSLDGGGIAAYCDGVPR